MDRQHEKLGRKRSEASRRAILAAVLELLRRKDYGSISVDEIATEAGVGKQTIYRWWSNKGEVVLEALRETAQAAVVPLETGNLRQDLEGFLIQTFRSLRGQNCTGPLFKGLIAEAQLNSAFAPVFGAFIAERKQSLIKTLASGANRSEAELDVAADMVYGAMWYRLLLDRGHLTDRFASQLTENVCRFIQGDG